MTDASTPPPGWYPDPHVPSGHRWWDGTQWTEHAGVAPAALKAPAGTKTDTIWIWLIVLLPLLSVASIFLIDFTGYMRSILANPSSPGAMLSLYTSPGYIITMSLSVVLFAALVVFALLDYRALKARGVPQPFHWAWAFLSIVYPIGRSVVVKRRTGGGLNPLWALIAVYVISFVVSIIWSVVITTQMMSLIPAYTSLTT